MATDRIVIDQTKIRISDELAARMKPGAEFPRPLAWWQHIVPIWLTASEDTDGHIVLTPNGHRADGHVYDVTPTVARQEIRAARQWLAGRSHLDFTDAIVNARPGMTSAVTAYPSLIDGLAATIVPDHTREQWTATGAHRLSRGDIVNLTRTGPVRPVVVLAVEPRTDDADREVVHITARDLATGKDVHETRPASASLLVRCDLRYAPATGDPSPVPVPTATVPRPRHRPVADLHLPT